MIRLRQADERGTGHNDWLESYHSFSFGRYVDRDHVNFGPLRVINEDTIAPGKGFATHPHEDMEIITWVLGGALSHRDSLGSGSTIGPGDAQHMGAGTGIRHSEFNGSETEPVHLLQIWLHPAENGLAPCYREQHFSRADRHNTLALIASGNAHGKALVLRQDCDIYAGICDKGVHLEHRFGDGRGGWLQVTSGTVSLNGISAGPGDGLAISGEPLAGLDIIEDAEFLLFDMNLKGWNGQV